MGGKSDDRAKPMRAHSSATVRSDSRAETPRPRRPPVSCSKCIAGIRDWFETAILGETSGHYLLLLVTGASIVLCGAGVWSLIGGNADFDSSFPESFWISYMLFIDPGTQTGIGVQESIKVKMVAVVVSLVGFIFSLTFLGTVVELIRDTLRHWKDVHRRFNMQDHVLILGWSDKTFFLLSELLSAERDTHFSGDNSFWRFCGRRSLEIVILAKRPENEMMQEVRMYFQDLQDAGQDPTCISYRMGDPTDRVELMKVSAASARSVLVMNAGQHGSDQEVIRTLLALAALPGGAPKGSVYGEMQHPESTSLASTFLPNAEGMVSRTKVNRMMVLRALVPSVGFALKEIASFKEGTNEIYLLEVPAELSGLSFFDAAQRFTQSIMLGVKVGGDEARLNPDPKYVLAEQDELLLLARSIEDAHVGLTQARTTSSKMVDSISSKTLTAHDAEHSADVCRFHPGSPGGFEDDRFARTTAPKGTVASDAGEDILRDDGQLMLGPSVDGAKVVLMIGCPNDFPSFLEIIDCYLTQGSTVHLLSRRDISWRSATLKAYKGDASMSVEEGFGLERVEVHHYVGDATRKGDLARLPLASASCAIILADRDVGEDPIAADTRTLTTAIALKALLDKSKDKTRSGKCKIATEILDAETEKVISINNSVRKTGSFVYTCSVEAGLLAMAVVQRTGFDIVSDLLERRSEAGYIIAVPTDLYVTGKEWLSFLDLRERVWKGSRMEGGSRGILLGWRRKEDRYPVLNPKDKKDGLQWKEGNGDELIVMRKPNAESFATRDSKVHDFLTSGVSGQLSTRFRFKSDHVSTPKHLGSPVGTKELEDENAPPVLVTPARHPSKGSFGVKESLRSAGAESPPRAQEGCESCEIMHRREGIAPTAHVPLQLPSSALAAPGEEPPLHAPPGFVEAAPDKQK